MMPSFDTDKALEARRELEAVVEGIPDGEYSDVVEYAHDTIDLIDEAFRVPEQSDTAIKQAVRQSRTLKRMTADGPGHGHASRTKDILENSI